jgi:uncharacterized coiled-coil protein SlyX
MLGYISERVRPRRRIASHTTEVFATRSSTVWFTLRSFKCWKSINQRHVDTVYKHEKRSTRLKERIQKWADDQAQDDDSDPDTLEDLDLLEEISNNLNFCEKIAQLGRMPTDYMPTIFNDIGIKLCSGSQCSEALFFFRKTLETLNNSVPVNSKLVAKTHDHMATALEGLERIEEAIYSATQATEIASSVLGTDHPDTQAYQTHLDRLMR